MWMHCMITWLHPIALTVLIRVNSECMHLCTYFILRFILVYIMAFLTALPQVNHQVAELQRIMIWTVSVSPSFFVRLYCCICRYWRFQKIKICTIAVCHALETRGKYLHARRQRSPASRLLTANTCCDAGHRVSSPGRNNSGQGRIQDSRRSGD